MSPLPYGGYTTYHRKAHIAILIYNYRKITWKGRPKRVIAPYPK